MSRNMFALSSISAVALFTAAMPCSAQQLLTVSGKALGSIDELQGALSNMDDAKAAAAEIMAGRRPTKVGSDKWAQLTGQYRQAAEDIRNAPLVTAFNENQYSVSFDQVTNSNTHDAAIAKLHGNLAELQNALTRGHDEEQRLAQALQFTNASDAAVTSLIDASAKLTALPDIGNTFAFQWADLELVVQPAIRDFRSAIQAQTKSLEAQMIRVMLYESNLRSNLPAWEALCPKSQFMGSWHGRGQGGVTFGGGRFWTYHTDFVDFNMTLTINRQGVIIFAETDGRAIERVVVGGRGGISPNRHEYRSVSAQLNGNLIGVQFARTAGAPTCTAMFRGTVSGSTITGSVILTRQDWPGNNFTVAIPMTLRR